MSLDPIQVQCPIYLVTSDEPCWKCGSLQTVVAIAAKGLPDGTEGVDSVDEEEEIIFLTNVASMPSDVYEYIVKRNPRYMKRHSKMADSTYYANTCECGANFGDFYLFSEPGGAFFPDSEQDAARIKYHQMPFSGLLIFDAGYSMGLGNFIFKHGVDEAA